MAQVAVVMTSQDAQLWQGMQKIIAQQTKMEKGFKKVGQGARQAGAQSKRAFGSSGMATLAKFTGGLATVSGAYRLITAEIRQMLEVQERAKETTMTLADAQIKFRRNLGATTDEQRKWADAQIAAISAREKVPERDLYLRASTAISAKGALPSEAAMRAVAVSAELVPEDPEAGTAVAGAILDLMKITGDKRARANMGLLQGIAERARVTDLAKIAENVAPTMTAVTMRGDTPQEAGALWAAITGAAADPTGRKSKTGTIGLAEQLAKFLPRETTYKWDKKGKRIEDVVGTGLASTRERIFAIQKDRNLFEQFMQGASFEKQTAGAIEGLLTGKGAAAGAYSQFLRTMPTVAQGEQIYAGKLKQIQAGSIQQTAQFNRALEASTERLQTINQPGARRAIAIKGFTDILKDTGQGWAVTKMRQAGFWGRGGGITELQEEAEEQARRLLAPKPQGLVGHAIGGIEPTPRMRPYAEPTELQVRQAEVLGELAKVLGELKTAMNRNGNGTSTLSHPDDDPGARRRE